MSWPENGIECLRAEAPFGDVRFANDNGAGIFRAQQQDNRNPECCLCKVVNRKLCGCLSSGVSPLRQPAARATARWIAFGGSFVRGKGLRH